MKNKNSVTSVIQVILILYIMASLITFYRAGCTVDKYGVLYNRDAWPMDSLWLALFLSLVAACIFGALRKKDFSNKKKMLYILIALLIAEICYSTYAIINSNYELNRTVEFFDSPKSERVDIPNLQSTSLEHIDSFLTEKESAIIFITRDTCPDCKICEYSLAEFLSNEDVKIWKYDTTVDRETRKDYMLSILERYQVDTVPAIIVTDDGEILHHFGGETIFEDFKEYCLAEHERV